MLCRENIFLVVVPRFVWYWKVLEFDCLSWKVLEFWNNSSPRIAEINIVVNCSYLLIGQCEWKTWNTYQNVSWQFFLRSPPSGGFAALFSNLEIMRGGLPRAVSAVCHFSRAFTCVLYNVYSIEYGRANFSNFQSLKN